jgi:hypothetical protein
MQRTIRSLSKDALSRLRRRGGTRALIVIGCQRSGTTMMLTTLDRDRRIKVFDEFSPLNVPAVDARPLSRRADLRFGIRLAPLPQVAARLERLRFPMVAMKPLVESQRAGELLDAIPGSTAVWMYRDVHDVSRSIVRKFGEDVHRRNLEPIVSGSVDDWRSERVSEDVRAFVREHYSAAMDPYDGAAVFWYARNRIYFDEGLDRDPRVMLLNYEDLAERPAEMITRVYAAAGWGSPPAGVADPVHARSVGAGRELSLSPAIEAACEELWERMCAADARSGATSAPGTESEASAGS